MCRKDLPPRAHFCGEDLLPRDLLDAVLLQHNAQQQNGLLGDWLALRPKLVKCRNCGVQPKLVYTSPGTGWFVDFPYCNQKFCPVCLLIDSRRKVGRFRPLLAAEIDADRPIVLLTLSFQTLPADTLAALYASFCLAWNRLAGKRLGSLVDKFFGGLHVSLKGVPANGNIRHEWRLHLHLFAVCNPGDKPEVVGSQLLAAWSKAVRDKIGRSAVASWADEFRAYRNEFRADDAEDSATRILKYLLNGFLGPSPEDAAADPNSDSLPVRDWPADKILEAAVCVAKPGFQRFRASKKWKELAKANRTLRLYLRRRRNAKGVKGRYMKIDNYLRIVDKLRAGTKFFAHLEAVLSTLPEVYLDACLNECHWLAQRLRHLLDRHRPQAPESSSG
jgi:hypothetical protein